MAKYRICSNFDMFDMEYYTVQIKRIWFPFWSNVFIPFNTVAKARDFCDNHARNFVIEYYQPEKKNKPEVIVLGTVNMMGINNPPQSKRPEIKPPATK